MKTNCLPVNFECCKCQSLLTGSGQGSTAGRISPSNDSLPISLYYRQRQARGPQVRFTRRNADFSRLSASRLTAATVLTNCPPSTALLRLRTRSKTPPQPLGRLEELLGRHWDGLKRKKSLQSLVWDGGTAWRWVYGCPSLLNRKCLSGHSHLFLIKFY